MANANLVRVMSKARKQFGREYPSQPTEYSIDASVPGQITVYRDDKAGNPVKGQTFSAGSEAEYDSYNLSYTGTISKITDKCVTIVAYRGTRCEKVHRLHLHTFCWRNWDFDAAETARKNHETMMYI